MADKSQKTEQPTQKRIEKARKDGDFVTSREFTGALQFLAAVVILGSYGPGWFHDLQTLCRRFILSAFKRDIGIAEISQLGWMAASNVFLPLCIGGGLLVLVTLASQLAISRFGFSFGRLKPKWSRLSPLGKLKSLPKQNLFATVQTALTLGLCLLALYVIARRNVEELYMLPLQPLASGLTATYGSILDLLWNAVGVFIVFGCIDLLRQVRRYDSEMRMSRQEIRDEFKEAEGNPMIKSRIRRLQRAARRRKMLKAVETAAAVVVNPTHYAVALSYTVGSATAPMVVAKGRNQLALQIRRIATAHNIPLIENPPLAQALYKSAAVDAEIPPHFYRAVAEVLAYVFQVLSRST